MDSTSKKKRKLKPRPPVTATPLVVSDLSCLDTVGLTDGQFRAFVKKHAIRHTRIGNRVLVRADVLLDALDRIGAEEPADESAPITASAEPATVADVLARVGRKAS